MTRAALARIPSIVITSESSPFLPHGRKGSSSTCTQTANGGEAKAGLG